MSVHALITSKLSNCNSYSMIKICMLLLVSPNKNGLTTIDISSYDANLFNTNCQILVLLCLSHEQIYFTLALFSQMTSLPQTGMCNVFNVLIGLYNHV